MNTNNQAARVGPQYVPLPEDAARHYREAGGHLTQFSNFGEDPLAGDAILVNLREQEFYRRFPTFDPFFSNTVNGDNSFFREGLLYFIELTQTLQQ